MITSRLPTEPGNYSIRGHKRVYEDLFGTTRFRLASLYNLTISSLIRVQIDNFR